MMECNFQPKKKKKKKKKEVKMMCIRGECRPKQYKIFEGVCRCSHFQQENCKTFAILQGKTRKIKI